MFWARCGAFTPSTQRQRQVELYEFEAACISVRHLHVRDQKRVSESLELELQTIMTCHVGARNPNLGWMKDQQVLLPGEASLQALQKKTLLSAVGSVAGCSTSLCKASRAPHTYTKILLSGNLCELLGFESPFKHEVVLRSFLAISNCTKS